MSLSRKVEPANPSPCNACPWRTENHGKPHTDGWYTIKNRVRLWSKLRRGDSMTCHPTDPDNPCSDGVTPVSPDAVTHECTGALILQQREVEKCQGFKTFKDYAKVNKLGLTLRGFAAMVERFLGGVPLLGRGNSRMPRPDLNEPVSHPPVGEWDPDMVLARKKALGR